MLVIGEKINASNKSVGKAIVNRDRRFIESLAKSQAAAGAEFIDVNAGYGSPEHEVADMKWLVEVVQEATEKPLAIDSDSPFVIEAALRKYHGERVIINSVTAETENLASICSLASGHQAWIVALVMGKSSIPEIVEERLTACEKIMEQLNRLGIEEERIFFDPLALSIAVNSNQGLVTLKTLERIKSRYPVAKTILGLSNISYGLPHRKLVNRSFLLMAAYAGLDAVIMDPLDAKAKSFIKLADMLTGRDPSCKNYIRAYRKGDLAE
jgi:5-methyltetrahydrofolate--homocysteine methyltransferase